MQQTSKLLGIIPWWDPQRRGATGGRKRLAGLSAIFSLSRAQTGTQQKTRLAQDLRHWNLVHLFF
jgi:hypothetical protein